MSKDLLKKMIVERCADKFYDLEIDYFIKKKRRSELIYK